MTLNLSNYNQAAFSYEEYLQYLNDILNPSHNSYTDYNHKTYDFYLKKSIETLESVSKLLMLEKKLFNILSKMNPLEIWVLTEPWCNDASQILPVIYALEIASGGKCTAKYFLRDKNEELMNQFLTNGSKSIPIVLFLDTKHNVLASWGPRTENAKKYAENLKSENLEIPVFVEKMSLWYNEDKTKSFQDEIYDIFKNMV